MPLLSMSLNYILVVYINLDNCQIWFLYPACLKNQTMTQIVFRLADEKFKNSKEERNKEKSKKQ